MRVRRVSDGQGGETAGSSGAFLCFKDEIFEVDYFDNIIQWKVYLHDLHGK